jgi:hypothetical protein
VLVKRLRGRLAATRRRTSQPIPCHLSLNPASAVEERSFHGSSRHLALLLALAYCAWLLVVRNFFGKVCCGGEGACVVVGAWLRCGERGRKVVARMRRRRTFPDSCLLPCPHLSPHWRSSPTPS